MGYNVKSKTVGTASAPMIQSFANPVATSNSVDTTPKIWLDLKECLPILQSLLYLPTSVFKNLRLVVEFIGISAR